MYFFSMFAWWPTIPIVSAFSSALSNVFSCLRRLTVGSEASDYETSKFLLLSSLTILIGLIFFHSVLSKLNSFPFLELFEGEWSSFSPFLITLGLYCYLCELIISLINSMSFY